jgi:hypothetical protein
VEVEEEELEEEEPKGETDVQTSDPDDLSFEAEAAGPPTELEGHRGLRCAGSLTDLTSSCRGLMRRGLTGNRSPPRKVTKMGKNKRARWKEKGFPCS